MFKKIKKIFKYGPKSFMRKRALKGDIFLLKLYYLFFQKTYDRQILSIFAGVETYYQKKFDNTVLLTRNIHRIEKGLIMPNPRREFALDYITETVNAYITITDALRKEDENLLSYASSVLSKYFQVVDLSNPKLKLLSDKFFNVGFKTKDKIPYLRNKSEVSTITYQELELLYRQRRSVRFFESKKVDRNLIEKAAEIASLSPSACNRQPFKLVVADENPIKDELGALPMGANSYYKNVSVFIALIGDLSSYFDERDRHLIYIDGSLFAMSFMLALETLGLASCPINWPDIEKKEKKLASILGLKNYERCIMIIGLGYPDQNGLIPYSNKKSSSQLIRYI